MVGVQQTRVGADVGNCFQACLASLLELEVAEVPDQPTGDEPFDVYCCELDAWLQGHYGLRLWWVPIVGDAGAPGIELARFTVAPPGLWIAGARVTDEYNHAIVCRGRDVVWDPSPWPMPADRVHVEGVFTLVPDDPAAVLT